MSVGTVSSWCVGVKQSTPENVDTPAGLDQSSQAKYSHYGISRPKSNIRIAAEVRSNPKEVPYFNI
jgi:hypothetical protein